MVDDVARIKAHPLVPKMIPVHGYIYDVKTGKLVEVERAKAVGAAGWSWPTARMECLPRNSWSANFYLRASRDTVVLCP